jgi:transposase
MYKIAMAPCWSSGRSTNCFLGCATCSPTSVDNGPNLRDALAKLGHWTIEIVKRAADAAGFEVLPRRWVVEQTLAWLNRNRRSAKDFETSIASAKAWVYIASV